MNLQERRQAEFPQYERPAYYGVMKPWRVAILADWLGKQRKAKKATYLDVGCGPAESIDIAKALHFERIRGCDVVQSVCNRDDVDLIPGAHDLGRYRDREFHITTSNDVMEHLLPEDVPAALREMDRVTKHAVFLGISRKPGPFHPCIQTEAWWLKSIRENMRGTPKVVYADRIPAIKQPYLFVEVTCD